MRISSFLLLLVILISGCSDPCDPKETIEPGVYVAGVDYSDGIIAYWKNGEKIPLTDGTVWGDALGIVIHGDDIYVAGWIENEQGVEDAVYWKNGELHTVSSGTKDARAMAMAVSGNDVYLVGYEIDGKSLAVYWKNGERHVLEDESQSSTAEAITISGTDVYIAGRMMALNPDGDEMVSRPLYWKNEEVTFLSDGSVNALARAIAVEDDHVYVAGFEIYLRPVSDAQVAVYWKDGSRTALTALEETGEYMADVTGIAVAGGTAYVSGNMRSPETDNNYVARYWVDGDPVEFAEETGSPGVFGITVSGGDVYTTGKTNAGGVYWRNDTVYPLEGGNVIGKSIAVVVPED